MGIDIIIPCYNSHKTIERCLASVAMQTIKDECKVTLVNDGGKGYSKVLKRFQPLLNIQEIRYQGNKGPGFARNFGIQNTENDLLMFIDSDDALATPLAIAKLKEGIESDPSNIICISNFIEEVIPLQLKERNRDTSFMHGKMYRRDFLRKHNIFANIEIPNNEDVGFNILTLLLVNHVTEKIKYIDYVTYYWLYNPVSIVRKNKLEYDHSIAFIGFAENLIYAFEEAIKRGAESPRLTNEKLISMLKLILTYAERTANYMQYKEKNRAALKKFYDKIYRKVEDQITNEMFEKAYSLLPFRGDADENKQAIKRLLSAFKQEV